MGGTYGDCEQFLGGNAGLRRSNGIEKVARESWPAIPESRIQRVMPGDCFVIVHGV